MKKKHKPFVQHVAHDIEDLDTSWDHIEDALSHVGYIIMGFNGLEKDLDRILCQTFSDRSDAMGLIVLQNMPFSAKVNLFKKFSDDFHQALTKPSSYDNLIDKLGAASRQRNIIAHADWENTDEEGYTYTRINFSGEGMQQEYVQLTRTTLESVIDTISDARNQLDEYWEARATLLARS